MNIKSAKYGKNLNGDNNCIVIVEENREEHILIVPLDPDNTEYTEIMQQVRSGKITIAPADEE